MYFTGKGIILKICKTAADDAARRIQIVRKKGGGTLAAVEVAGCVASDKGELPLRGQGKLAATAFCYVSCAVYVSCVAVMFNLHQPLCGRLVLFTGVQNRALCKDSRTLDPKEPSGVLLDNAVGDCGS